MASTRLAPVAPLVFYRCPGSKSQGMLANASLDVRHAVRVERSLALFKAGTLEFFVGVIVGFIDA